MEQNTINVMIGYVLRVKELNKQLKLMTTLGILVNVLIAGIGFKVGFLFSLFLYLIHIVAFSFCSSSITKEKAEIFAEFEKIAEKEIEGQVDVKEKIHLLFQRVVEYIKNESELN